MSNMSTGSIENNTELERTLASLTAGPEGEATLWRKALENSTPPVATRTSALWTRRIPAPWLAAACVVLLLGVAAGIMPSMGKARSSARGSAGVTYEVPVQRNPNSLIGSFKNDAERAAAMEHFKGGLTSARELAKLAPATGDMLESKPNQPTELDGRTDASSPAASASLSPDRFVIRKSTLDLATTDVRGTFAKTSLVLNEALGEYIETSSLTGEGANAYATITLRVAANRLSDVLNQLRALGTVISETSTGQDVTETVVDLEARIRNEQRIERELLALIDKRPDAPLKDLLEIRAQLASIRGQIESLIGQRERIGRLVSLATVLVTIRAQDAPKLAEKAGGIGDYFLASIDGAWHAALRTLSDTTAFLIRVIVGGVVWWILAIIVVVAAWKASKRTMAKRAAEPVPLG